MFVCVLTDSLSAQRAHTHGRRVRHSSSDSSGSDCSAESGSSSLHSRSPSRSPEVPPDPSSPANRQPPCSSKEVSPPSLLFLFCSLSSPRVSVSSSGCVPSGEFSTGSGGLEAADGRCGEGRRTEECVCVGEEGGRGAEVALGISVWVSCQQARA